MINSHIDLIPNTISRKVDFKNLFSNFTPQIIKHGKDTLDLFIQEGLAIRASKPTINTMSTNGFV